MSAATRTGRVLVVIPTYNERESLPGTLAGVRRWAPDVDVLIVDDSSPDGTGRLAEELAAADTTGTGCTAEHPRRPGAVHVLHRADKQGLGPAYVAGFGWGAERGYDVLVEMDADGSHRAEDLPALLARSAESDLVIGSRWVRGGRVQNWPLRRQALSRAANVYARVAMGLPVRDATAGFRAYRTDALRAVDLGSVASHGYCFQIDMTWRLLRSGGRVVEVPITFVEREHGTSKMSRDIVLEALVRVTVWGAQERWGQLRALAGRLRGRAPAAVDGRDSDTDGVDAVGSRRTPR